MRNLTLTTGKFDGRFMNSQRIALQSSVWHDFRPHYKVAVELLLQAF